MATEITFAQLDETRDLSLEELKALCETLNSKQLRQVKDWWEAPTTERYSGFANRFGENKQFTSFLKEEISLRHTQDVIVRFGGKVENYRQ